VNMNNMNTSYSGLLLILGIIFLGSIALSFLLKSKKKINNNQLVILICLAIISGFISLYFADQYFSSIK